MLHSNPNFQQYFSFLPNTPRVHMCRFETIDVSPAVVNSIPLILQLDRMFHTHHAYFVKCSIPFSCASTKNLSFSDSFSLLCFFYFCVMGWMKYLVKLQTNSIYSFDFCNSHFCSTRCHHMWYAVG